MAVLGLALFPLVALPVIVGRSSQVALERSAIELQQQVAAGMANQIASTIRGRSAELAELDQVVGIRTAAPSEQHGLLSALMSHQSMYQELALVEPDGRDRVRVARDRVVLSSESNVPVRDPVVDHAFETGSEAYGPVVFDTEAREPLMEVARPLVDLRSGETELVLVAILRFKPIWQDLADLDQSDRRDVFVINEDGLVVAHRNPSVVLRGTSYRPPLEDGSSTGVMSSDAIVASASVGLGDQELIVVAEQPRSVALEAATEALGITVIVGVLALAAAFAAIASTTRRVIRPIEEMAVIARRAAGGRLDQHVAVDRDDEIGDLAQAFNHMISELRGQVESLEKRVDERTLELEAAVAAQRSLIRELESNNEELARIQEKLEELLRSKDEFLGSVSHELRTPLASVVGFATELRDRYEDFDPVQRREFLALIADQGQDMAHIINDLLVAARADADSLVVRLAPVDLEDEVNTVLRQVDGVRVSVETAGADVSALADAGRVRQILRNLVVNARRYGGPNVTISIADRGETTSVAVCDDGPGIPESEWERIFDPYSRSHHREGQPASVGLGLTVSRILARRMCGDLTYRYEDRTSIFELELATATGIDEEGAGGERMAQGC